MGDELLDFLREGLVHYPQAFAAVTRFQEELCRVLVDALVSREAWSSFVRSGPPSTGTGGNAKGCWIYALQSGALDGRPERLEVGFWWNAPGGPKLVAYASPVWSARDLATLGAARPTAPARVGLLNGKNRFFLEVNLSEDLAPQVEHLVDELTKFLATPSDVRTPAT